MATYNIQISLLMKISLHLLGKTLREERMEKYDAAYYVNLLNQRFSESISVLLRRELRPNRDSWRGTSASRRLERRMFRGNF